MSVIEPNPLLADITGSVINLNSAQDRAKGNGHLSPTVSAPDIHYTTTVDASAFVFFDTCVFLAYSKTFKKRVLHTLRLKDTLSLTKPRKLYLEDSPDSSRIVSIFDLIAEKFDSQDPPSMYILHPRQGFSSDPSEYWKLSQLYKDLKEIDRKTPFTSVKIGFFAFTESETYASAIPDRPVGMPRVIKLMREPTDEHKKYPAVFDGSWMTNMTA